MGIAKDLSRVKSNITAALSAIAEKGVTVPDGSNSDALAELIASIEAGGGGKFANGTITPARNISLGPGANFEIETGFLSENKQVNFVLLLLNGAVASGQYNTHFIGYQSDQGKAAIAYKTVSNTDARYDTMYYDSSSASTYFKYDNTTGVVTLHGKHSSQVLDSYYGNSKISWAIWKD